MYHIKKHLQEKKAKHRITQSLVCFVVQFHMNKQVQSQEIAAALLHFTLHDMPLIVLAIIHPFYLNILLLFRLT